MTTASRNWRRRSLGLAVAAAPVMLAVLSLFAALRAPVSPPASLSMVIGTGFLIVAIWIACRNFYTSFLRYPLLKLLRASTIRNVSGYPVVGTLAAFVSLLLGFGSLPISALALAVLAIDTGGAPWFVACTWRSGEIWDGAASGTSELEVEPENPLALVSPPPSTAEDSLATMTKVASDVHPPNSRP